MSTTSIFPSRASEKSSQRSGAKSVLWMKLPPDTFPCASTSCRPLPSSPPSPTRAPARPDSDPRPSELLVRRSWEPRRTSRVSCGAWNRRRSSRLAWRIRSWDGEAASGIEREVWAGHLRHGSLRGELCAATANGVSTVHVQQGEGERARRSRRTASRLRPPSLRLRPVLRFPLQQVVICAT